MKIPDPYWWGEYPENLEINLVAIDKSGYDFIGWADSEVKIIVHPGDSWKYLDNGSNQGTSWVSPSFTDAGWNEGNAQLGYGDGDENTVVGYGGDPDNKYITTYFRHHFTLDENDLQASSSSIRMLCDDGAIVYINGEEVLRHHMPEGPINNQTLASTCASTAEESTFTDHVINNDYFQEGENVIAVEVHQCAASSSDISFDLELSTEIPDQSSWLSTSPHLVISLNGNRNITAVYESNGQCMVPEQIDADLLLSKDCSPWVVQGNVTIAEGATLTIEPGVDILMPEDGNFYVKGKLIARGNEQERITFRINPEQNGKLWGALCFTETEEPSELAYVTISSASDGSDPARYVAAISAFKADLMLDNLILEDVYSNPIAARYSDVILTNSTLHSRVTGDLINVKYGHARIENCEFRGNLQPDTDGIDYDGIDEGLIRNCRIYDFYGFNSDAIDIGEEANNIEIDSVLIFDITDKGVSVGQKSSVFVTNCTFVNCNLGLGLKDSCRAVINQCTFYGNTIPVSCFEKNPGRLGGNGIVLNSILSNSYDHTFFRDSKSTLEIRYSLSDNENLVNHANNYFDDPLFMNPTRFDFRFQTNSPCILAGDIEGTPVDLGSGSHIFSGVPELMFYKLFYNPNSDDDRSEFISILNPTEEAVDLFGHMVMLGIDFTFTDHLLLNPGEEVYLVKDIHTPPANSYPGPVREWTSGNLANEGERLRLVNASGMILDQVDYSPEYPWPSTMEVGDEVLTLIDPGTDNHFGYNWEAMAYRSVVATDNPKPVSPGLLLFPNPSHGFITISHIDPSQRTLEVWSITGELVLSKNTGGVTTLQVDLSALDSGIYFIRSGDSIRKLIINN